MTWVFAILLVLALGGIAAVAAGRGTPLAPATADRPEVALPTHRTLAASDLRTVRFSLGFRGYRMDEVDALLDRLATELESREPGGAADPGIAGPPA